MHVAQREVEANVDAVDDEKPLRQARVDAREMRARSLEESTPRNRGGFGRNVIVARRDVEDDTA